MQIFFKYTTIGFILTRIRQSTKENEIRVLSYMSFVNVRIPI